MDNEPSQPAPVSFPSRLNAAIRARGNPVVVGLDPRPELFPTGWFDAPEPDQAAIAIRVGDFCRDVIDVVCELVPAVKIQAAFYERFGPDGMIEMAEVASYARDAGLLVILDGKRNDIGTTAEAYAQAYLGSDDPVPLATTATPWEQAGPFTWQSDALTINPYLGGDGVKPFLDAARASGKGVYLLVRTSNPSAGEFQDLICDGIPVYEHVARRLAVWADEVRGHEPYSLLGAVIGATYPEELARLREILPGVPFLVPGYGAQGGTARDVAAAFDDQGLGAVVNNSRGIMYAFHQPEYRANTDDWQVAVEQATHAMIADLAEHTNVGRLRASN